MTSLRWHRVSYQRERVSHVLPVEDAIEHIEAPTCWCQPNVIEDGRVVVHHSADGREQFEDDPPYPPASRH